MEEIWKIIIPVILTGAVGYILGIFNKKKERDFELAKIKAELYNQLFISLRPALYSDYLENKTQEEENQRFFLWQSVLLNSDKMWLYSSVEVLAAFKSMFKAYSTGDKDLFNKRVNEFVQCCRLDVLRSLGKKGKTEDFNFLTYNLPRDLLSPDINRLNNKTTTNEVAKR